MLVASAPTAVPPVDLLAAPPAAVHRAQVALVPMVAAVQAATVTAVGRHEKAAATTTGREPVDVRRVAPARRGLTVLVAPAVQPRPAALPVATT